METGRLVEGRYLVEEFLGEGNAGKVFTCIDKNLKAKFAIKVLHSTASEKTMARFHSEAKATAKLNHLNVVKVFDFGQTKEGQAYLILEYCKGQNLSEFVADNATLSLFESLKILHSIASGLQHAHDHDIVHRDIKPSNIILTQQPDDSLIPKIVDFGVAKIQTQDLQLTQAQSAIGSPRYMSPESIDGTKTNYKSDIYSFGCLAYELLAGELPFDESGKSSVDVMKYKTTTDFPPLSEFTNKSYPKCIDQLLYSCLKRKPTERTANASELLSKIESCLATIEEQGYTEEAAYEETKPLEKKPKYPIIVGFAAVTTICIALCAHLVSTSQTQKPELTEKKTRQSVEYKPKDLFDKLEKTKLVREQRNGKTWYRFTGVNDAKDLAPLSKERNIKRLRLPADNLLGHEISILAKMNLLALDLVQCSMNKETLEELSKFSTLEELSLRMGNQLNDDNIPPIANLGNLRKLDLSYTDITDNATKYLAKLPKLEEVSFDGCMKFNGSKIKMLKSLKVLDLMNCGFDTKNLSAVSNLKSLKILYLNKLNLKDSDVLQLDNLQVRKLYLDENIALTDSAIAILSKNQSLKFISINKVKSISKQAELAFRKDRPDCKLLVLRKGDQAKEHVAEQEFIQSQTKSEN